MPVFILDEYNFLVANLIGDFPILSRLVVAEEPHTLIHVLGVVAVPHGEVVGEPVLEQSIATMFHLASSILTYFANYRF